MPIVIPRLLEERLKLLAAKLRGISYCYYLFNTLAVAVQKNFDAKSLL